VETGDPPFNLIGATCGRWQSGVGPDPVKSPGRVTSPKLRALTSQLVAASA
jgi:hypothetical protein